MSVAPSHPETVRLAGAGVGLAADVYGEPGAPPVLLLHGGGQTRHAWGSAAMALAAAGRRAYSIDLRGHGNSDWSPDGAYGLGRFAADVETVASGLYARPALVGASLGGLAALIAVGESEHPVATALVLVDVAPKVETEGREKIGAFMRSGMRGFESLEDAADTIAAYLPHRPRPKDLTGLRKNLRLRGDGRWYWHWDPRFIANMEGVDGQEGEVRHERLCEAARRVDIPTLLVKGGISDIVSDEGSRELHGLIPQLEVADVAGAGHMVAGDKNDAFNHAVIEFINRAVRRDGQTET
jgi:pimeloyl-ACP methyl ester carboxylesterase